MQPVRATLRLEPATLEATGHLPAQDPAGRPGAARELWTSARLSQSPHSHRCARLTLGLLIVSEPGVVISSLQSGHDGVPLVRIYEATGRATSDVMLTAWCSSIRAVCSWRTSRCLRTAQGLRLLLYGGGRLRIAAPRIGRPSQSRICSDQPVATRSAQRRSSSIVGSRSHSKRIALRAAPISFSRSRSRAWHAPA